MKKIVGRRSAQLFVVGLSSLALSSPARAGNAAQVAQTAGTAAMQVAVVSAATGTALKVPCFSAPPNTAACIMMGLAVAQVGLALTQKSGSDKSAGSLSGNYTYGNTGSTLNTDGTTTTSLTGGLGANGANGSGSAADGSGGAVALTGGALAGLQQEYKKLQEQVTAAGVSVSPDGKSASKNGKKASVDNFASAASMKAAGFSESDIAGVESALNDAKSKAADRLKGLASLTNDVGGGAGKGAGGGDYGGGSGAGGSGYDPYGSGAGRNAGLNAKSPSIAGMSKKLGDDNIGVAGDNIFDMITRRYQARDKQDNFLKDK